MHTCVSACMSMHMHAHTFALCRSRCSIRKDTKHSSAKTILAETETAYVFLVMQCACNDMHVYLQVRGKRCCFAHGETDRRIFLPSTSDAIEAVLVSKGKSASSNALLRQTNNAAASTDPSRQTRSAAVSSAPSRPPASSIPQTATRHHGTV